MVVSAVSSPSCCALSLTRSALLATVGGSAYPPVLPNANFAHVLLALAFILRPADAAFQHWYATAKVTHPFRENGPECLRSTRARCAI